MATENADKGANSGAASSASAGSTSSSDIQRGEFNRFLANWILNDLRGLCRKHGCALATCGITSQQTWALAYLMFIKEMSRAEGRAMVEQHLKAKKAHEALSPCPVRRPL